MPRQFAAAAIILAISTLHAQAAHQPATRHSPPASTAASALHTDAPLIAAVGPLCIVVSDLDQAVAWYTTTLDFIPIAQHELAGDAVEHLTGQFGVRCRVATLALGDERIELIDYLAPEGRPLPTDSRSNDRWFQHIAIVVRDIDEAYARLRAANVRHASTGPQTLPAWNVAAAGISAFYFKDPDGHVLEIIHFPPTKGDPRWHIPDPPLFIGIDHTAIVVRSTSDALALYRDALGMRVVAESENHGIEQERLNNVFGARLRITTLRAPVGPGVELLEYLTPATGRDYPADSSMSDLWSWRTTLITTNPDQAMHAATRARATWLSIGVIETPPDQPALNGAAMLRDPDGHAILLTQP